MAQYYIHQSIPTKATFLGIWTFLVLRWIQENVNSLQFEWEISRSGKTLPAV